MPSARRRGPWALFALMILIVPFIEIVILVRLGQAIGAGWTILILIADAILGAWLVRKEGRRAWEALVQAFSTGRMPGKELADAALVLVGGTLLITPGFVTDVIGLVCVIPLTRPLPRWLLARAVSQRMQVVTAPFTAPFGGPTGEPGPSRERYDGGPDVVQGDVVEDE